SMEILVRDRQGNQSETVQLPLTFAYVEQAEISPEWQVSAKRRLGVLVTRIRSTESMTGGS
ncbi:MAG: hypothetical protein ABUK17_10595, partial [Syntrophobacteria bacterium]